ncbi:hypothetical protein INR49_005964 [Caranx melampygus]|nr:hypothetical protein INR49_005964 [Caranx melampygus]
MLWNAVIFGGVIKISILRLSGGSLMEERAREMLKRGRQQMRKGRIDKNRPNQKSCFSQTRTFKLLIEFSEEYPNKPPTVRFVSRMFHPNVYADGSICLDILQNRWSPTYDVSSILTSIQSLLDEPNPNSPANSQAAQLYQENKREYEKRVTAIVEQSWVDV